MSFLTDIQFALGQMRKRWALTLGAAVSLALCIGLNTAVFSVFNAALLRPLPFPEPDRIVEVFESFPGMGFENAGTGRAQYTVYKAQVDAISGLALFQGREVTFGGSGGAERLQGLAVTPDFFSTTRLVPALGNAFREEHGLPGNEQVVLLAHGFWQNAFGGNPDVIGSKIILDGRDHTVLGVLPVSFRRWNPQVSVLIPYAWNPASIDLNNRHATYATLLGRLADGAAIEQAQAQLDAISAAYRESNPGMVGFIDRARHQTLVRLHQDERNRAIGPVVFLLQALALGILLIGAVNVANLRLAEVTSRERELMLRRVLGGSRAALLRQLLVEAGILAVLGGILGVVCSWLSLGVLRDSFALIIADPESITLDGMVLLVAACLVGLVIIVVGLYPARILWKLNFQELLQEGGRGSGGGRGSRLRISFGVVQATLAVVFLVLVGLFVRSFIATTQAPLGFEADRVTTFRIELSHELYPNGNSRITVVRQILEELRALPGVEHVGGASITPAVSPGRSNWTFNVRGEDLAGEREAKSTDSQFVTDGFFEAMGIKTLRRTGN